VSVPSLEESHRQLGLGDALEKWVKGILLDHAAVDSTALTSVAAAAARACACACVCFGGWTPARVQFMGILVLVHKLLCLPSASAPWPPLPIGTATGNTGVSTAHMAGRDGR
jgi:hypothetical protein